MIIVIRGKAVSALSESLAAQLSPCVVLQLSEIDRLLLPASFPRKSEFPTFPSLSLRESYLAHTLSLLVSHHINSFGFPNFILLDDATLTYQASAAIRYSLAALSSPVFAFNILPSRESLTEAQKAVLEEKTKSSDSLLVADENSDAYGEIFRIAADGVYDEKEVSKEIIRKAYRYSVFDLGVAKPKTIDFHFSFVKKICYGEKSATARILSAEKSLSDIVQNEVVIGTTSKETKFAMIKIIQITKKKFKELKSDAALAKIEGFEKPDDFVSALQGFYGKIDSSAEVHVFGFKVLHLWKVPEEKETSISEKKAAK